MDINLTDLIIPVVWIVVWSSFGVGIFESQKQNVYLKIERLKNNLQGLTQYKRTAEIDYQNTIPHHQSTLDDYRETLQREINLFDENAKSVKDIEKEIKELENKLGVKDEE